MKYFCNHYKDPVEVWSTFETKEKLEEYICDKGGCFNVKEAEIFNPDWIKEEIKERKLGIMI